MLDTMTNVVGILVIVLVVTQLGVRDAVKRIGESTSVDPEKLAAAQAKLEDTKKLRTRLAIELTTLGISDEDALRRQIAQLERLLAERKEQIDDFQKQQQQQKQDLKKEHEEILQLLEKQKEEIAKLQDEFSESDKMLAELRALLADTPDQKAVPAKVISLPDPRPAPKGMQPLVFLCHGGQIAAPDIPALEDRAQRRAKYLIQRRNLDRDKAAGIDGDALLKYFNQDPIRSRDVEVTLKLHGPWPKLVFEPRSGAGETTEQIQRSTSRFQQGLKRVDTKKYFAQFLVWPDSFETYLAARRVAADEGMLAGWQPMGTTEQYLTSLGAGIRCGPPPKPQPKPAPGTQKPAPKKPPVPIDIID